MKRIITALATTAASVVVLTGAASALVVNDENSCSITNTGTLSSNNCTLNLNEVANVTCTNNVYVQVENDQEAVSGYGVVVGNTNAGGTTTGDANNNNVVIGKIGASCGAAPVATPAATTPVAAGPAASAPVGGRGADVGAAAAKAVPKVAALPHTGSNTVTVAAVTGVALLGATAAVSQFGVSAFRRGSVK